LQRGTSELRALLEPHNNLLPSQLAGDVCKSKSDFMENYSGEKDVEDVCVASADKYAFPATPAGFGHEISALFGSQNRLKE